MAIIYFNSNVDGNWDTILNWYTNSGGTIPAGHIPQTGDYVRFVSMGELDAGPSAAISLVGYDNTGGSPGIPGGFSNITISNGTLVFVLGETWDGNYVGTLTATFDGGSTCAMALGTGVTAVLNGGTSVTGIISGGVEVFSGGSAATSTSISGGTQTFNDSSAALGTMISGGTQIFHDDSLIDNSSVISGGTQIFDNLIDFGNFIGNYAGTTMGSAISFDGGSSYYVFNGSSPTPPSGGGGSVVFIPLL